MKSSARPQTREECLVVVRLDCHNVRSIKVVVVHLSDDGQVQVAVSYSESVALVEPKDSLLVQALNALPIGSVYRRSKWLIVPNLSACFNQISSCLRHLHNLFVCPFLILDHLLLSCRYSFHICILSETNPLSQKSLIYILWLNIAVNGDV
jgi:hypothetical protein